MHWRVDIRQRPKEMKKKTNEHATKKWQNEKKKIGKKLKI